MPDLPKSAEYITDGTTFVNPLGMAFTLVMCILIVVLPRRHAWLPVILLMCYMTMGMRIMIADLNFTMMRILLFFGYVRILARQEYRRFRLTPIDKAMLWFTLSSIVTFTLLWQIYDAFKNKMGMAYTVLGFYFLARLLLREWSDVVRVTKMTALCLVPLAVSVIFEKMTGTNCFAIFSGVPAITVVRMGVLRCQGPFAHPILAGTFGATLLPTFLGLWFVGGRQRWFALVGIASCLTIVVCSASSGPMLATGAAVVAWGMWFLRRQMQVVRWALVGAVAALAMLMKAPVWYIMARMDVVSGSTGYHRAYLLDTACKHLSEWWLVGTKSTAAWDEILWDVTNQYLVLGTDGGLITLALFLVVLAQCFRGVGISVRRFDTQRTRLFFWGLGAALFAHVVSFMSIMYFDQNVVNFYTLLAVISTLSAPFAMSRQRVPLLRQAASAGREFEVPQTAEAHFL